MTVTIAYTRRSSESGDDYSLDTQAAACREYAVRHGLGECEIITEHYTGTIHLRDREQGAAVWRKIESGQVSNLIVYSADRLSRAPLRHALQQIDEIVEAGVRLHTVDSGEITSTDSIDVVIKSWASAQERAKIVDRFTRGRRGKAQAGRWIGSGPAPYGFTRVGQRREARLEHNPDAVAVLKLMIDLYLGDPPRSVNALRDELFKRGIPSPGGRAVWAPSCIARVLGNSALIGRFTYGDLVVEIPELAIIDQKTWNAIQDRMESNRQRARRNRKRDYLMTSRLKCICGHAMTADRNYATDAPIVITVVRVR